MLIWNEKQWRASVRPGSTVVIWCLFEMRNSVAGEAGAALLLWFDAHLKCETVPHGRLFDQGVLWFDAHLKCETVSSANPPRKVCCDLMLIWNVKQSWFWPFRLAPSCDLMLIWNVKQYNQRRRKTKWSCDLMLIWNVKQCVDIHQRELGVVIWCSFEMWNSSTAIRSSCAISCDLMLIWNVKQCCSWRPAPRRCCDLMLIWNVKQCGRSAGGD